MTAAQLYPYTFGYKGIGAGSDENDEQQQPGAPPKLPPWPSPTSMIQPQQDPQGGLTGEQLTAGNLRLAKAGPRTVGSTRPGKIGGRRGATFSSGEFRGKTLDQARAQMFEEYQGGGGSTGLLKRRKRTPEEIAVGSPVTRATRALHNKGAPDGLPGRPATKQQTALLDRQMSARLTPPDMMGRSDFTHSIRPGGRFTESEQSPSLLVRERAKREAAAKVSPTRALGSTATKPSPSSGMAPAAANSPTPTPTRSPQSTAALRPGTGDTGLKQQTRRPKSRFSGRG